MRVCMCVCLPVFESGGVGGCLEVGGGQAGRGKQSPRQAVSRLPLTQTHTLATGFRGDPDRQTDRHRLGGGPRRAQNGGLRMSQGEAGPDTWTGGRSRG